jgi:protein gp37
MGKDSKIEWTDHTFNPWIGCQKVSPACKNCYASVDSPARVSRSIGLELWGPESAGAKRRVVNETNWRMPIKWNNQGIALGRQRVFCASQADQGVRK